MTKSSLLLLILLAFGGARLGFAGVLQRITFDRGTLILEGQVKRVEKDSEDSHFFTIKATLTLSFRNVGTKPS